MYANFRRLTVGSLLLSLTLPYVAWAQSNAAQVFKANCVACHSADGSGNSPVGKALQAKDLRSAEVQKQTNAALAGVIGNGNGKMPPFAEKIKPEDIDKLVAYIRQLAKKK